MNTTQVPPVSAIHFTPFTSGKIRWWFSIMDVDKDGSISQEDFHLIADRFIKEYQLDEVDAKELRDRLVNGWGTQELEEDMKWQLPLIAKMVDDFGAGLKISQEAFITAFEQLIQHNSQVARNITENMVSAFFDIFDYDHDNYITKKEFVVAMRCFDLDELEVVDTVFTCMDDDKDGRLSRSEYIDGWLSFILGQDKDNALVIAFAPHLRDL